MKILEVTNSKYMRTEEAIGIILAGSEDWTDDGVDHRYDADYDWINDDTVMLDFTVDGKHIGFWDIDASDIDDVAILNDIAAEVEAAVSGMITQSNKPKKSVCESNIGRDELMDKYAAIDELAKLNSGVGYRQISGADMMTNIRLLMDELGRMANKPANDMRLDYCMDALRRSKTAVEDIRGMASTLASAAADASKLLQDIGDYLLDIKYSETAKTEGAAPSKVTLADLQNAKYSDDIMQDPATVHIGKQTFVKVGENKWEHVPYGSYSYPSGSFTDAEVMHKINEFDGAAKLLERADSTIKQENNNVSSDIPDNIDDFLKDVAQMTNIISYNDIIKFDNKLSQSEQYRKYALSGIEHLISRWGEAVLYEDELMMDDIAFDIKSYMTFPIQKKVTKESAYYGSAHRESFRLNNVVFSIMFEGDNVSIKSHHPYDDADYHYAVSNTGGEGFEIYRDGKFVEAYFMKTFEEDEEDGIKRFEWTEIARELARLDKKVEPRMMHN